MDDFKLSQHFTFFELTVTENAALQEQNRAQAILWVPSLKAVCDTLLEPVRNDKPLILNSGFRSWELNGATPGSSPTSQHPRGQAADFHRKGQDMDLLFAEILGILILKKIQFGQFIDEQANRGYKVSRWLHLSLGANFWKPERCGEVLKMVAGPNGKPQYTTLQKIPQEGT